MMTITDTSYNFTALTPTNSYTVTVAGRNNAGVGVSSVIVVNTTTMIEATPSGTLCIYVCTSVCMYVCVCVYACTQELMGSCCLACKHLIFLFFQV